MDDFIRKSFLAGIGFLALTEEKFRKNIENFVKKGEFTEKEGKEFINRFKDKYRDFLKDIEKKIDIQVNRCIEKAGLAKKSDIIKLEKKLKEIELKINKK